MKILFSFLILVSIALNAQDTDSNKKIPIEYTLFSNTTSLPGSGMLGLVNTPLHPGFTIGSSFRPYRITDKSCLFQSIRLGFFYHRLAQKAIQVYSELGWQHRAFNTMFYGFRLGGGYLHSFADVPVFVADDEGNYHTKGGFGRPQFMASLSFRPGITLALNSQHPFNLFLEYQFWMQFPFVKGYVPILPNTSLHLGLNFYINKKSKV